MGAGIAPQIAKAFDGVLQADKDFEIPVGSAERLGKFSSYYDHKNQLMIVNAYTQFTFTGRESGIRDVDYDAVKEVFTKLNNIIPHNSSVGIPAIGAGLAGGQWNKIESIINKATPDISITFVQYYK